jgi:hypothetical protein
LSEPIIETFSSTRILAVTIRMTYKIFDWCFFFPSLYGSLMKISNTFKLITTPKLFSFHLDEKFSFLKTFTEKDSHTPEEINIFSKQLEMTTTETPDEERLKYLALFWFYNQTNDCDNLSYYWIEAKKIIDSLQKPYSDENLWYLSFLIYHSGEKDSSKLKLYLDLFQQMKSKNHKKCLAAWILEIYETLNEYPSFNTLKPLENFLAELNCSLKGFCSQTRTRYILKNSIENQNYFDFSSLKLVPEKNNQFTVCIDNFSESVDFYENDLRKFAAHIVPLSRPILNITFNGVTPDQQNSFNYSFEKKMKEMEIMNEEGIFVTSKFKMEDIQRIVNEILKKFDLKIEENTDFTEKITNEIERINSIRSELAGLTSVRAISIASKCFISRDYGLDKDLSAKIKKMLEECAKINILAKKCEPTKNWKKLADELVDSIKKNPRDVLFQVGTPKKSKDENSTHAFYVALKNLDNGIFEIVITNGGTGIEYHEKVENQKNNERELYHYVTSEPFYLKNEIDSLKHYIYRLISLEFQVAPKGENISMGYECCMKNVYLLNSSFVGHNGSEIKCFKRKKTEKSFFEQITGNCTIHNLKESLQYLYCNDELEVGLLEANMILGFDKLISDLISDLNNKN